MASSIRSRPPAIVTAGSGGPACPGRAPQLSRFLRAHQVGQQDVGAFQRLAEVGDHVIVADGLDEARAVEQGPQLCVDTAQEQRAAALTSLSRRFSSPSSPVVSVAPAASCRESPLPGGRRSRVQQLLQLVDRAEEQRPVEMPQAVTRMLPSG